VASVDGIVKSASQIYTLYGQPDHLRVEHPDCPHTFPREMREVAYHLFDAHLR
jgi:hypothetical protein